MWCSSGHRRCTDRVRGAARAVVLPHDTAAERQAHGVARAWASSPSVSRRPAAQVSGLAGRCCSASPRPSHAHYPTATEQALIDDLLKRRRATSTTRPPRPSPGTLDVAEPEVVRGRALSPAERHAMAVRMARTADHGPDQPGRSAGQGLVAGQRGRGDEGRGEGPSAGPRASTERSPAPSPSPGTAPSAPRPARAQPGAGGVRGHWRTPARPWPAPASPTAATSAAPCWPTSTTSRRIAVIDEVVGRPARASA